MLLDYNPTQGKVAGDCDYQTSVPLSPLNRWVQSYWQLTVPKGQFQYRSVPDNCVDWIINLDCFEDNFLIPPFLSSTLFQLDGPASFFGIRFRILGHKGLIAAPLGEWVEIGSVQAQELIPKDIVYSVFEVINHTKYFDQRCNRLSVALLPSIKFAKVDPRLARYIRYCHASVSSSTIELFDSKSAEFGVSERQLRRLAKQHIGLVPKDFARVLKFQHVLKAMNASQHNKAYLDHYYDQPHFIREFKRLSGVTPAQFKKMSVLYNL
ncbi:helix-turn-helix domain-containing protein [Catenovulum sp. SM1970]|uniref:helix-turn-helix domain-containing protein n=1 Tax=Marinifaba aquimaris TaxID=2741323 RepID=UPI001574DFF3|nr:DUF6597 domain-containing transcriptional factor [Marinifaba aquimaris]NTS77112.1 helix-turn-helix domain-containing protein [Marinifaba aquimaris]